MKRYLKGWFALLVACALSTISWAAKAVYLYDAGATSTDGWYNQTTTYNDGGTEQGLTPANMGVTDTTSGVGFSITETAGKYWAKTPSGATAFAEKTAVLAEMASTLGLASIPDSVYKDGLANGGQKDQTLVVSGLDDEKLYTLYFICGSNTDSSGFQLDADTYETIAETTLHVVRSSDTGTDYGDAVSDFSAEQTASTDVILLARLAKFRSKDGAISIALKGERSAINALAIAEVSSPYVDGTADEPSLWSEKAQGDAVTLVVDGDATLEMDVAATVESLTLNPLADEDTLTIVGDDTLNVATTAVNLDTDVSAITANLGAVTLGEGVTLTIGAGTTFTTVTGGALEVKADTGTCVFTDAQLASFEGTLTVTSGTLDLTLLTGARPTLSVAADTTVKITTTTAERQAGSIELSADGTYNGTFIVDGVETTVTDNVITLPEVLPKAVYLFDGGETATQDWKNLANNSGDIAVTTTQNDAGIGFSVGNGSATGNYFARSLTGRFPEDSDAMLDMATTLGLSAIPESVYSDAIGNGGQSGKPLTVTGLNNDKLYVLYLITGRDDLSDIGFKLDSTSYNTEYTPTLAYARSNVANNVPAGTYTQVAEADLHNDYKTTATNQMILARLMFKPKDTGVKFTLLGKSTVVALAIAEVPESATVTRSLAGDTNTWAESKWGDEGTAVKPNAGDAVTLTTTGAASLEMNADANVSALTIGGTASLTFVKPTGKIGTLVAETTEINVDTDVSAIPARLGAVTVASGATLTIGTETVMTSVAGEGNVKLADGAMVAMTTTLGNILTEVGNNVTLCAKAGETFDLSAVTFGSGVTLTVGDTELTGGIQRDTDKRVIEFDVAADKTVPFGATEATLVLDGTTIEVGATAQVELLGAAMTDNVPEAFRENFAQYQTVTIPDETGGSSYGNVTDPTTDLASNFTGKTIHRVGYYMELKRAGLPAQFVWVTMDAFNEDIAKVGFPTDSTGVQQALVNNLRVYGNRGNFANTTADATGITGVIEFTAGDYGPKDGTMTDGLAEAFTGDGFLYGWNDRLTDGTGATGCMQIARANSNPTSSTSADYLPPAEMLFAYNNFRNSSKWTDVGIGSFSAHRKGTNGSATVDTVYDWTHFSANADYVGYKPSSYEVKKIEVWVQTVVAKVGDVAYGTVAEAVAAAANGTVTIVGEVTVDNLDLSNGATLAFEEGATLTVANLVLGTNRTIVADADKAKLIVTGNATLTEGATEDTPIPLRWTMGAGATVSVIALEATNNQDNVPYTEENINFVTTLYGKGAWFEYLFEGNLDFSGRETDAGKTAIQKKANSTPVYEAVVDGRQAATLDPTYFWVPGTVAKMLPFDTLSEFSVSLFARMPSKPGSVFISFGKINYDNNGALALVAGEKAEEVLLVYIPGKLSGNAPTVLAQMTVPNADSDYHLYTFVRYANRVEMYLDETLWTTYEGSVTLAKGGVQMGEPYGGFQNMTATQKTVTLKNGNVLTMILAAEKDGDTTLAAIDMLRMYDCRLTAAEVARIAGPLEADLAGGYTYESPAGTIVRTIAPADVINGTTNWSVADAWDDGTETKLAEPTSGLVTLTNGTSASVTVTMNNTTECSLETLSLKGEAMVLEAPADALPKHITVTGATTIDADVKVDCAAMTLGGPVTVTDGHTLTLKVSPAILTMMASDVLKNAQKVTKSLTGTLTLGTDANILLEMPTDASMPTEWKLTAAKDETTNTYQVSLEHNPWFVTVTETMVTWKSGETEETAQPLERAENISATVQNLAGAPVTVSGVGAFTLPGGKTPMVTVDGMVELALTMTTTDTTATTASGSETITVPATTIDALVIESTGVTLNANAGTIAVNTLTLPADATVAVKGYAPATLLTVMDGTLDVAQFTAPDGLELTLSENSKSLLLSFANEITVTTPDESTATAATQTAIAEAAANVTTSAAVTVIDTILLNNTPVTTKTQMDDVNVVTALFENVVTVEDTDNDGTATAKVSYDFGIEKFTIKKIGTTPYLVLKAKVRKSANETAKFAVGTAVKVYKGNDVLNSALPLSPSDIGEGAAADGEVWFKIPLDDAMETGTHSFIIKAEKN